MSEQNDKVIITTPRGMVAGFTSLQTPSTNFDPDGVYETQLAFDLDEVEDMVEQLEAVRDAKVAAQKKATPKFQKLIKSLPVYKMELDDDGEETGRVLFKFKQKAIIRPKDKPSFKKSIQLVDARGQRITAKVKVGAGSIAKVNFECVPYFAAKDKEVGVTLRLIGFQLIKLVEYTGTGGPSASDMGFGSEEDEDGFDASEFSGGEDQTDEGGDASDESDF